MISAAVPAQRDRAVFQDVGAVGVLERQVRVLLDDEDGRAGAFEVGEDAEDLLDDLRREAGARFVEHQQFGRAIRARPIASICCSPPESENADCVRRSASAGKRVVHRREVGLDRRGGRRRTRPGECCRRRRAR